MVIGGVAQAEQLPGRLGQARQRRRGPGGEAAVRGLDALGAQHRGDELAEDDRLAVGDEVGLAGRAPLGRQQQALDDVVDVGRVGDVAAAADPGPFARLDRLHHLRQQRRVALAPDEAGPHDDGLEALAARVADRLLGLRLGRRVGRRRVGSQRRRLVDPDQRLAGHQRRLGAAVDEAPHPRLGAGGEHVARALDVAALEVLPRRPTRRAWAARWKAVSQPAAAAASEPRSPISPRTGSAPSAATRCGGLLGARQRPHRRGLRRPGARPAGRR